MTDRDAINVTFKMVCALIEKLTGERLAIRLRLSDGRHGWVSSSVDDIVDWQPVTKSEASAQPPSQECLGPHTPS